MPLLLTAGITSCATTPTQDEDLIAYGEEPEGPGVFSGDSGEIVLFKEAEESAPQDTAAEEAATPSNMSEADWQEFTAFKRWLKSRQARDADYEEFLQWLKYEEYRQWQNSQ